MAAHEERFASEALRAGEPAVPLSKWVNSIGQRLAAWAETCADYYRAAGTYEQLSALSNAELARRGLFRATVGQYACAACDRGPSPPSSSWRELASSAASRATSDDAMPHARPKCRAALQLSLFATILLAAGLAVSIVSPCAAHDGDRDGRVVRVMTQNVYEGTNFPSPVGPIVFKRGWASVDVKMAGRTFRFATTHLDPVVPAIRQAQANELLQGIGNTLPVILVGDFNANPSDSSDPTHQSFLLANFDDAWLLRRPFNPGSTCCQEGDLLNPKSLLSVRLDWVLFRGRFRGDFHVLDAELIGDKRNERTRSGLWPSDHAGVAVKLRLPQLAGH